MSALSAFETSSKKTSPLVQAVAGMSIVLASALAQAATITGSDDPAVRDTTLIGTSEADVFDLKSGDDAAYCSAGADIINMGEGSDRLRYDRIWDAPSTYAISNNERVIVDFRSTANTGAQYPSHGGCAEGDILHSETISVTTMPSLPNDSVLNNVVINGPHKNSVDFLEGNNNTAIYFYSGDQDPNERFSTFSIFGKTFVFDSQGGSPADGYKDMDILMYVNQDTGTAQKYTITKDSNGADVLSDPVVGVYNMATTKFEASLNAFEGTENNDVVTSEQADMYAQIDTYGGADAIYYSENPAVIDGGGQPQYQQDTLNFSGYINGSVRLTYTEYEGNVVWNVNGVDQIILDIEHFYLSPANDIAVLNSTTGTTFSGGIKNRAGELDSIAYEGSYADYLITSNGVDGNGVKYVKIHNSVSGLTDTHKDIEMITFDNGRLVFDSANSKYAFVEGFLAPYNTVKSFIPDDACAVRVYAGTELGEEASKNAVIDGVLSTNILDIKNLGAGAAAHQWSKSAIDAVQTDEVALGTPTSVTQPLGSTVEVLVAAIKPTASGHCPAAEEPTSLNNMHPLQYSVRDRTQPLNGGFNSDLTDEAVAIGQYVREAYPDAYDALLNNYSSAEQLLINMFLDAN